MARAMMRPAIRGAVVLAVAGGLALGGIRVETPRSFAQTSAGVTAAFDCKLNREPTLVPTDPKFLAGDISGLVAQQSVDCFAWQTFIALNWPVDPAWPGDPAKAGEPDRSAKAADWGRPIDPTKSEPRPVVWETFKPVQEVFVAKGEPTPWGVSAEPPPGCETGFTAGGAAAVRRLSATSKFAGPRPGMAMLRSVAKEAAVNPDETEQVFGGWLTDQAKRLAWYERLVDRAEFEYIVAANRKLYLKKQQDLVAMNADGKHADGLTLPLGTAPDGQVQTWQDLGAIEIKAAWRILTGLPDLWPRYHVTKGWLYDPEDTSCSEEVIGLVGLHIVHKTTRFPNWLWSTFEHVDNVPASGDPLSHPFGFSFNNPDCKDCKPNQPRVDCSADGTAGGDRDCKPLFPKDAPVQVERIYPIPSKGDAQIQQLNRAMQEKIRKASAGNKSVYQYYQLVNTQWAQSPVDPYTFPKAEVPLKVSSMTSGGGQPVANVTLETYIQRASCITCHKSATIADSKTLASDFSFIFRLAKQ